MRRAGDRRPQPSPLSSVWSPKATSEDEGSEDAERQASNTAASAALWEEEVTVYVDDVRHSFGRMKMCHMWADTEEELLAMVDKIGVQRKWIQRPPKASWVHFDISLSKKALALKAGAVLTDVWAPVEHVARLRIASGVPGLVAYGRKQLDSIARIRAMGGRQ